MCLIAFLLFSAIIWQTYIRLVIVIFILHVCVYVCVRVPWTQCLAKSLWGSLNRLCFPSGESIQVTDTESWLQSKWPLKSWKCLLIWHLTISDVAVEHKRQFSPQTLGHLPVCFLHLSPERKSRGRCKDLLWLCINMTGVRLWMNRVPCTSQWRCCFLFLLHCLIWVMPDCFGSHTHIKWTWCSDFIRPKGKRTKGHLHCVYVSSDSSDFVFREIPDASQRGHSHLIIPTRVWCLSCLWRC